MPLFQIPVYIRLDGMMTGHQDIHWTERIAKYGTKCTAHCEPMQSNTRARTVNLSFSHDA